MTSSRFRCRASGEIVEIDTSRELGSGGEARIFAIDERRAAKIYLRFEEARDQKLAVMLANPPIDHTRATGHVSIAWPSDVLDDVDSGRIAGMVMPRVRRMRMMIEMLNPKRRRATVPGFDYRYLHRAARNVVAAVGGLHARGYVVGDLNESNILLSDTALATLVDLDSIQVRDGDRLFRCGVGKLEYTAPELQGKAFADVNRSIDQDHFALGILVFQLLMEGTHPFAGVSTSESTEPLEQRIAAGHWAYQRSSQPPYRPRALAPPIDLLHPRLRDLFAQCFDDGHRAPDRRPRASQWVKALKVAELELAECEQNSQHRFGLHLDGCPWCARRELLGGHDPFPPTTAAAPVAVHSPPVRRAARAPRNRSRAVIRWASSVAAACALAFVILYLLDGAWPRTELAESTVTAGRSAGAGEAGGAPNQGESVPEEPAVQEPRAQEPTVQEPVDVVSTEPEPASADAAPATESPVPEADSTSSASGEVKAPRDAEAPAAPRTLTFAPRDEDVSDLVRRTAGKLGTIYRFSGYVFAGLHRSSVVVRPDEVWVGVDAGLLRLDRASNAWTLHRHGARAMQRDLVDLGDRIVQNLAPTGHKGASLACSFDRESGEWRVLYPYHVTGFDGMRLWGHDRSGIVEVAPRTGRRVVHGPDEEFAFAGCPHCVSFGCDRTWFLIRQDGISRVALFDRQTDTLRPLTLRDGLRPAGFAWLDADEREVWAVGRRREPSIYELESNQWRSRTPKAGEPRIDASRIVLDGAHAWFGGKGLWRLDRQPDTLRRVDLGIRVPSCAGLSVGSSHVWLLSGDAKNNALIAVPKSPSESAGPPLADGVHAGKPSTKSPAPTNRSVANLWRRLLERHGDSQTEAAIDAFGRFWSKYPATTVGGAALDRALAGSMRPIVEGAGHYQFPIGETESLQVELPPVWWEDETRRQQRVRTQLPRKSGRYFFANAIGSGGRGQLTISVLDSDKTTLASAVRRISTNFGTQPARASVRLAGIRCKTWIWSFDAQAAYQGKITIALVAVGDEAVEIVHASRGNLERFADVWANLKLVRRNTPQRLRQHAHGRFFEARIPARFSRRHGLDHPLEAIWETHTEAEQGAILRFRTVALDKRRPHEIVRRTLASQVANGDWRQWKHSLHGKRQRLRWALFSTETNGSPQRFQIAAFAVVDEELLLHWSLETANPKHRRTILDVIESFRGTHRLFRARRGQKLEGMSAPCIGYNPFEIRALVSTADKNGVIVAQGGQSNGWSVFLEKGVPNFTVRRDGKLYRVRARNPVTSRAFRVVARHLGDMGKSTLELTVDGVTTRSPGGGIGRRAEPLLEVGQDSQPPTGPYASPFRLTGQVEATIDFRSVAR